MKYVEIQSKSACNKIESKKLPYKWDLNVYRGCEHGCKYCFALYSNQYLNSSDHSKEIFIKQNIVDALRIQLNSTSWKGDIINLGGVTDNYQQIEREKKLMPDVLKLLITYKNPCTISTKSTLILRDKKLFTKLAESSYVNIATTIITTDENLRIRLEPFSSTIEERLNILNEFSQTKVRTSIHIMPIIPYINDDLASLESIFMYAKKLEVNYIDTEILNLIGLTRIKFFKFLESDFPELINKYKKLYKCGYVHPIYEQNLEEKLNLLREKYNFPIINRSLINKKYKKKVPEQLSMF